MKLVSGNKIKMTLSVFVIGQIYAGDSDKSNDMIGLSNFTLNADKRSVKVTPTPIGDNSHYVDQNVFANTSANENILESLNTPQKSIKNAIRLKVKRKNSSTEVINNKFSDDICIKKIVTCVLEGVREFVNKKIMEEEEYKTDKAMKLTPVNYDSIIVDNNFIHKNVDDIFSSDTSNKQQTRETNHNEVLINKLMKDKKKLIMWYLGRKFIEYVDYFSGNSSDEELKGMKRMCDCKKEMASDDDNYFNHLIDVARKFENIINKKNQSQKKSETYNSSKDIILESTGNINRKPEDNGSNINLQISDQYSQKNYLIIPKFNNPKQGYSFLNTEKDKTLRGRKRKNPSNGKIHDRNSDNNCIAKIKAYVLEAVREFINKKIKEEYDKKHKFIGEFKKISQKNYTNNSADHLFINKTIREIFSLNVSEKYSTVGEGYNRNLIKKLVKDNANGVLKYLGKTFIEFVEHFSGVNVNEDFEGLKTINDFKAEKVGNDADYFEYIENVALNFRGKIQAIKRRAYINGNHLNNIQEYIGNKKRKLSYNKNSTNLQISPEIKSKGINCLISPVFGKELQDDIDRNLYNNIVENKNEGRIGKVDVCVQTEREKTSDDDDDDNGITETHNIFKKNIL